MRVVRQPWRLPALLPHVHRMQGCKSNQLIDTAALGGPKVAVVSTLASVTPACPFLFTNYELPPDSQQRAAALRACSSSSKHLVWQVGPMTHATRRRTSALVSTLRDVKCTVS